MQMRCSIEATQTRRVLTRARTFSKQGNLSEMLEFLRSERFTGTVELHCSQGALLGITAHDSHPIADTRLDIANNMS